MKEEWLSYIWSNRLYKSASVYSTNAKKLDVIHPGFINHFSGPDFNTAKLALGDDLLVGRVELHVKTSDYLKHGHQHDKAFDKLLAHVVWEHDMKEDPSSALFTIELKHQCPPEIIASVKKLLLQEKDFPCANFAQQVPQIYKSQMLAACLVERLEKKAEMLKKNFEQHEIPFVFLQKLAYAMGAPVNSLPMQLLMQQFDLRILFKLGNQAEQLEALLLGLAGKLEQLNDDYAKARFQQYEYLKYKFKLKPLATEIWKNGGMRPVSHPDRIIVLLANLLAKIGRAPLAWLSAEKLQDLEDFLEVELNPYWQSHYQLAKQSKRKLGGIGKEMKKRIILNCLLPFLFAYGRYVGRSNLEDLALELYEQLAPEQNALIKKYRNLGFPVQSSAQTQGIIGLHRNYCLAKKCLNCQVANHRLKQLHEETKKYS